MSPFLLVLVAVWLAWRWRRPRRGAVPVRGSAAYFNRWSQRLAITYGLPAVLGLPLLRQRLSVLPSPFVGLAETIGYEGGDFPVALLLGALACGMAIAALLAFWRGEGRGLLAPVIARPLDAAAYAAALLLALVAAITEELFFRLLLPLLIALAGAGAIAGFAASTLLFGWLHRYQGRLGMIVTAGAGLLFGWVYLASGWLWLAIAAHAAADVAALVVRPFFARLRTSAASRSGRSS